MSYSIYGAGAAVVLVAAIAISGVAGSSNWQKAKGTITSIDRTCNFIETRTSPDGHKTARGLTDSCNSTDEWDKVREDVMKKKAKRVSGKATMHVTYTAPQDGSTRTADIQFTGRDDEFYELHAGSEFDILVSKTDSARIKKA